jgi:hypothetical protein
MTSFDRRGLLAAGGAAMALGALPLRAAAQAPASPATALLDTLAEEQLRLFPATCDQARRRHRCARGPEVAARRFHG